MTPLISAGHCYKITEAQEESKDVLFNQARLSCSAMSSSGHSRTGFLSLTEPQHMDSSQNIVKTDVKFFSNMILRNHTLVNPTMTGPKLHDLILRRCFWCCWHGRPLLLKSSRNTEALWGLVQCKGRFPGKDCE